ncbi:MAG: hypothetical protein P3W95_004565 [Tepidimonas taiwanensis]|nr:hypothetical protein [Tepidimonas taiwanensis]
MVIFDRRPGIAWEDKFWQRSEAVRSAVDGGSGDGARTIRGDTGPRTIGVWGC